MKHRLSTRLVLMVLLPIFVSILLLVSALLSVQAAQDMVIKVQEDEMRELVTSTSSSIERLWISPRNHAAKALLESPALRKHLEEGGLIEEVLEEWAAAKRALEECFYIYYGLQDGTTNLYPDLALPEGYSPLVRPWYKTGMRSTGEPAWTKPYTEIITKKRIVSTVIPIFDEEGAKIGVFGMDVTLQGLADMLGDIKLPEGGSIFLLDNREEPFVGTKPEYVSQGDLPSPDPKLFVEKGSPLSSGWRIAIVIPRASLAKEFARLRTPLVIFFIVLISLAAFVLSTLVGGLVSRTRRLAEYFDEITSQTAPVREIFHTNDEFAYLNREFNQAISKARNAEEQKLAHERVFRLLLERAPVGFFKTHKDGSIDFINPYCAELLGYSREEARSLPSFLHFYENENDRNEILNELSRRKAVRDKRIRFVKKTGERIWVSMNAELNRDTEDEDDFIIEGFIVDVTKDIKERELLKRLAETDPLTGVTNRRAFDAAADQIIRQAQSDRQSVGMIIFDVDRFKTLNDTEGHSAGDEILKHITLVAGTILRKNDVFARLGGDEFAVILPDTSEDDAFHLASRLKEEMESVKTPSVEWKPSLSIGVSSLSGNNLTAKELLNSADRALYDAKRSGRDCISRASKTLDIVLQK